MRKYPEQYVYPAIFTYEENSEIAITFPDLQGCVSCGKNDKDALKMAKEALSLHLYGMENDDDDIPPPTPFSKVTKDDNEVVVPIEVFMPAYRLYRENKAVNRMITLPAWLNAAAIEKGINFSQALQQTLIKDFGIKKVV